MLARGITLVAILLFAGVGTALLSFSFAAKGGSSGGGGKPAKGGTTTTAILATQDELLALHNATCPNVAQYADCAALVVRFVNVNASWAGYAHPAENYIEYNTQFLGKASNAWWTNTISHEVGGHVDTWAELVSKVGTTKAWSDYYDIDKYAEPFFETKLGVDLTPQAAKEMYLDCQGAVRNGYLGGYLYGVYGKQALSDQQTVCKGYRAVFDQAVAS